MGLKTNHRKQLFLVNYNTNTPTDNQDQNATVWSESSCLYSCKRDCKCQGDYDFSPPPLPPPTGPTAGDSHTKQLVAMSMIVLSCIIVGTLLLGVLCAAIRAQYLKRRNSRRANPPVVFGAQEDFFDENHGHVLDHPIWYINTVGLSQSLIDSIAVLTYKKDAGLIEGTDCSVCLCEFQEDESLRLLPKCSHAFHISCIDTWLRSHTNCPLCRAPIISGLLVAQASESEPNPSGFDSRNELTVVISENYGGGGSGNVVGGTSEARNGNDSSSNNGSLPFEEEHPADINKMKMLPRSKRGNCDYGPRVLSDLAGNHRMVEEPMRRSVSLDSSAASIVYNAVA